MLMGKALKQIYILNSIIENLMMMTMKPENT